MTETNSVVDIPSSSQLVKDIMPSNSTRTSSSPLRHCNTPRGKRFTQKLLDAAKRSCHSENPLPTPTTSSSLSPSPGIYLDDDVLTDTSTYSCPSTPQQPTRLEKQQHISKTPSLSAKPKRRKLKQQKTVSWRVGVDATLDTNVVHDASEQPQHHADQQQQPLQQTTRAAKERANTKLNKSSNTKSNKQQVITLGITGSSAGSDSTANDTHRNTTNGNGLTRNRQRRIDTVDVRLSQLMYAHSNLDLGVYSIVPKKARPPVYIDLDDDDDDNTKRHSMVSTENQANHIDLTLPSPSTTSASHTTEVEDQRNDCATVTSSTPTPVSPLPSPSLPPSPESPSSLLSPTSLPTNTQQMQADGATDTSQNSTPKSPVATH